MALTIEEAIAVNKVLGYFCDIPDWRGNPIGSTDALESAVLLAAHSYRKLHAGIGIDDVKENWRTRDDRLSDPGSPEMSS